MIAAGSPVQRIGCNQTSHYALVRALADGTARIDPWQAETCDKSYFDGHFYSNKAPGLAFVALPPYLVLDALGAVPESPRTAIWALGLCSTLLAGAGLLLLMRRSAERVAPGTGTAAAIVLALGTLLLPFSTMLFAHILTGLLLFAAFLLAWQSRDSRSDRRLALAGLLAGLAVVVEYPYGLISAVIGVYVLTGPSRVRSGLLYAGGAVAGVIPLAAFNAAAFGSVTHLSYQNGVLAAGQSGHDVVLESQVRNGTVFGVGPPTLEGLADLLASGRGLLVATPVVAVALAALPLLWRRGHRAESALVGAVLLVALLWNSGLDFGLGNLLGGDVPGPRYLVPVLPFLALPLACALRTLPRTTGLLAAISVITMVAATLTEPLLGTDETRVWFERAHDGELTRTVLSLAGLGSGWAAALPAIAAIAAMAALAAGAVSWRRGTDAWWQALAAAGVWALLATVLPELTYEEAGASVTTQAALAVGASLLAVGLLAFAALRQRPAAP